MRKGKGRGWVAVWLVITCSGFVMPGGSLGWNTERGRRGIHRETLLMLVCCNRLGPSCTREEASALALCRKVVQGAVKGHGGSWEPRHRHESPRLTAEEASV